MKREIDPFETLDGSHIPWPRGDSIRLVDHFADLRPVDEETEPVIEYQIEIESEPTVLESEE